MSDATLGGSGKERKRAFASILVAVGVHAGILALVSLAAGLGGQLPVATQTVIDVQLVTAPVAVEPAPGEAASAGAGSTAGQLSEAPSLSSPAAASPAAASKPVAAAASKAPKAGAGTASASDFVIPTPRGQAAGSLPTTRGPAFQQSGSKTGAAAGLPAVQNQPPQPDAAVVPPVKAGGSGAASSSAGASLQRGGQGTLVQGQSGKGSAESLDMRQLDKSIASGAGGAGGAGAAKGSSGTGQSGTGSGQGTGGGGAGTGGSGPGKYLVDWDKPDANKGRTLTFEAKPSIPAWVSIQGLTLSVKVAFTLTPAGVIMDPKVTQSTGSSDVDNAVLDAIRLCHFSSTTSTALVKGVFTYVVKPE